MPPSTSSPRQKSNNEHSALMDCFSHPLSLLNCRFILSKFSSKKSQSLSREELEAMLGLSELKQTRVYQEAREEGRQEGLEQGLERGQLQTKLEIVPWLLELGLTVEEIAQRLGLDVETITQVAAEQITTSE